MGVSEKVFFDLLDTLRDYYSAKPKLSGVIFTRDDTYYYECSKFCVCHKLNVKDSIFTELYIQKLKEINDSFGL